MSCEYRPRSTWEDTRLLSYFDNWFDSRKAVRLCPVWVACWVADECPRAYFCVAPRCRPLLFSQVMARTRRSRAWPGVHGMQEVWGSNPHSSTSSERLFEFYSVSHDRLVALPASHKQEVIGGLTGEYAPDSVSGVRDGRMMAGRSALAPGCGLRGRRRRPGIGATKEPSSLTSRRLMYGPREPEP
jgi:hypothetical protein